MNELSEKVQEAIDLWMSIPLSDEYYRWLTTVDMPNTQWKNTTDTEAEKVISLLAQYKQEHGIKDEAA